MKTSKIVRIYDLIRQLGEKSRGISRQKLMADYSGSHSTFHRDIKIIEESGFRLSKEMINGEMRYKIIGAQLPNLDLRREQLDALSLSLESLETFKGTKLHTGLRELFEKNAPKNSKNDVSLLNQYPDLLTKYPEISISLRTIERSIKEARQIEISYQSVTSKQQSLRTVEAIRFRQTASGLYLYAFDVGKKDFRTFKIARIQSVRLLNIKSDQAPEIDMTTVFNQSVGMWCGEQIEVEINIDQSVARFVKEWPLIKSQQLENIKNGVKIKAQVSGLVETFRWVLSWGKNAEVIAPKELRNMVIEEIKSLKKVYAKEGVSNS